MITLLRPLLPISFWLLQNSKKWLWGIGTAEKRTAWILFIGKIDDDVWVVTTYNS
jgi:hypothetical protein